jgi:hypothetical protein
MGIMREEVTARSGQTVDKSKHDVERCSVEIRRRGEVDVD